MISCELSHLLSSLSGGRSAKPQLKNVIFGQSYRFGSSLYHFTVYIYISWLHHLLPLAKWMEEYFLHLHFSSCSVFDCLMLSFAALQLWYGMITCQCNCKSQLHRPVSSSETSFEFSLLEEARMSSHSDMLQALSLASVCVAKPNHRHGPMPWLSSSSIKIVKLQLPDWWQLSTKSAHVCSLAKSMRSSENTECSRAPWTAATSPRPAGAVLRSVCPR